jgi:hypothetical protein
MPRKPSSIARRPQATQPTQILGSKALAESRAKLLSLDARNKLRSKLSVKQRAALDRDRKRESERATQLQLKQVAKFGVYSPKIAPGAPLSKSQKSAVHRAYAELVTLTEGAAFAPFTKRARAEQRAIAAEIKAAGGRVTKAGVFLPRDERDMKAPTGRLIKKGGFWQIQVKKTFVFGPDRTRQIRTESRYLDGPAALIAKRADLEKHFASIPINPKTTHIRFQIHGLNVSKRSFRSIGDAIKFAERTYRKNDAAKRTFLDSLTFITVEKDRRGKWVEPTGFVTPKGELRPLVLGTAENIRERIVNRPRKRRRRGRS